jgi:hypothetical protein
MKTLILHSLANAVLAVTGAHARGGDESLDIDTRFRAKIAKEKVKQSARERELDKKDKDGQTAAADCGSQNIGVIDNSDRPGAAPREVFVFAPNAINLVTGKGCQ